MGIDTKDIFLLVAGLAGGAILSWLVAHFYYVRGSQDQRRQIRDLQSWLDRALDMLNKIESSNGLRDDELSSELSAVLQDLSALEAD